MVSLRTPSTASSTGHTTLLSGTVHGRHQEECTVQWILQKDHSASSFRPSKCINPVGLAQVGPHTPVNLTLHPGEDSDSHEESTRPPSLWMMEQRNNEMRCLILKRPWVFHYPLSPNMNQENYQCREEKKKSHSYYFINSPFTAGTYSKIIMPFYDRKPDYEEH